MFRTVPDLADRLPPATASPRCLLRVAVEVLALIALRQPVTRLQIEAVRGVSPGPASVDVLLDAGLIQPVGRRERRVSWPGSACAACATCRALAWRCRPPSAAPGEKPASPQTVEARLAVPTALVRPDRPPRSPRPRVVLTRDKRGYRASCI